MKHQDFTKTLEESLGGRRPAKKATDIKQEEKNKPTLTPVPESEVIPEPSQIKAKNPVSEPAQEDDIVAEKKRPKQPAAIALQSPEIEQAAVAVAAAVAEDNDTVAQKLERKKPGRKKMDDSKKKVQITLTVKHETLDALMEIRGYKQKLSWYFDDNVEELKEAIRNL